MKEKIYIKTLSSSSRNVFKYSDSSRDVFKSATNSLFNFIATVLSEVVSTILSTRSPRNTPLIFFLWSSLLFAYW